MPNLTLFSLESFFQRTLFCSLLAVALLGWGNVLQAEETPVDDDTLPGHSFHGEIFNEGPRQKARLMDGMPVISFDITTQNDEAKKFFNQGLGQIHGFWYFEAERSFRQVALLDPGCAMAYWGLAQANIDNSKRAKGFIEQAEERKGSASERERMYIEALATFLKADPKKNKERHQAYAKALEKILYKHPSDIECRALLALHLWKSRDASLPIQSYIALDAIFDQIFAQQPLHPAHHYRIHLWDSEHPENALASAAKCGQAAPGIAHMWHMPGHIFSRLKRYDDAAWQQEASARVDHAHMMRDRVMPDQIHNFAHNNEWLVRDLTYIGRAHDAADLAKNMCELPRHPKYNTLSGKGSTYYGRLRLTETLIRFRLWDELLAAVESNLLDPTDDKVEAAKRWRWLGIAQFQLGQIAAGEATLATVKQLFEQKQAEQKQAMDDAEAKLLAGSEPAKPAEPEKKADEKKPEEQKPEENKPDEKKEPSECEGEPEAKSDDAKPAEEKPPEKPADQPEVKPEAKPDEKPPVKRDEKAIAKVREEAKKKFEAELKELEKSLRMLEGQQAVATGELKKGYELLKKANSGDTGYLAWLQWQTGDKEEALKGMRKFADGKKQEVLPQADLIELLWAAEKKDEARTAFDHLRKIGGRADLDVPALARLAPIAAELGYPEDWRTPESLKSDIGDRPSLDALGPFRWQPSLAPAFTLKDVDGKDFSLADFNGKPVVLIFFLGNGCLHCAEQLQAFAKAKAEFDAAGLLLLAISSDDQEGLKQSIQNYKEGMPITLLSDADFLAFQAYRAYDDFENQPLHGTFVIDGQGRVRWQDISFEPFMDAKFVREEALRLLKQ